MTPDVRDFDEVCRYVAETVDAGLWRMVVVPRQVDREADGIMRDDETMEAELYNTPVGKVVSLGELAFKGKTTAHLDLSADSRAPQVGDWIVFHANASRRFELQAAGNQRVIFFILQDTDFLGRAKQPDRFRAYI